MVIAGLVTVQPSLCVLSRNTMVSWSYARLICGRLPANFHNLYWNLHGSICADFWLKQISIQLYHFFVWFLWFNPLGYSQWVCLLTIDERLVFVHFAYFERCLQIVDAISIIILPDLYHRSQQNSVILSDHSKRSLRCGIFHYIASS